MHPSALITPSNNEEMIEATYGSSVRPGLLLQPSLQCMMHPRDNILIPRALPPGSAVASESTFGANIVVNFWPREAARQDANGAQRGKHEVFATV
jgi:carbohydrate-selective porin OprB